MLLGPVNMFRWWFGIVIEGVEVESEGDVLLVIVDNIEQWVEYEGIKGARYGDH